MSPEPLLAKLTNVGCDEEKVMNPDRSSLMGWWAMRVLEGKDRSTAAVLKVEELWPAQNWQICDCMWE